MGTLTPVVLVLDGEQRAALAVTRSLGRRGCTVHVASSATRSIAGGSRHAASESRLPDAMAGSLPYAQAVAALVGRLRPAIVVPVTESATLALLEHRGLLPDVVLPTSDLAHFQRTTDKAQVLALAATVGITVPAQWTVTGAPEELAVIPVERYPVVIKPARSVVERDGIRRKVSVQYAANPAALREAIDDLGHDAGPFLLQERIEGPGTGVFLLRWNNRVLASFAHRRIREKPPSGGVSVCCESVAPPAELLARSARLLEALDWNGVAMIEFKVQQRTGDAFLMEINPRFWGSLQLAIDAGVDFPWYLVQAALGAPGPVVDRWRVGIRSRWGWGDVDHLIARLRRSDEELDLPPGAPGRFSTALQVLFPWRAGQKSDVFRWSDPVPGWRESVTWVRDIL